MKFNGTVAEKVAWVVRAVFTTYGMAVFHARVETVTRVGALLSISRTWLEQYFGDIFNTSAVHEYPYITPVFLISTLLFTTYALKR